MGAVWLLVEEVTIRPGIEVAEILTKPVVVIFVPILTP
jgi:hypothetical protein